MLKLASICDYNKFISDHPNDCAILLGLGAGQICIGDCGVKRGTVVTNVVCNTFMYNYLYDGNKWHYIGRLNSSRISLSKMTMNDGFVWGHKITFYGNFQGILHNIDDIIVSKENYALKVTFKIGEIEFIGYICQDNFAILSNRESGIYVRRIDDSIKVAILEYLISDRLEFRGHDSGNIIIFKSQYDKIISKSMISRKSSFNAFNVELPKDIVNIVIGYLHGDCVYTTALSDREYLYNSMRGLGLVLYNTSNCLSENGLMQ